MSLSRLLAYRSQIEEALRIELAAAARLLQQAADQSAACEVDTAVKQRRYAEAALAGLTVDETSQWYAEIETASLMARRAAEARTALQREWRTKQADVIEAMQERKKLDILVRRRREAREQEQLHDDQRLMDEQAARRRRAMRGEVGRPVQSGSGSHG